MSTVDGPDLVVHSRRLHSSAELPIDGSVLGMGIHQIGQRRVDEVDRKESRRKRLAAVEALAREQASVISRTQL